MSETTQTLDENGDWIDLITDAFGVELSHQFTNITYAGKTPTTASGITFQFLVKASPTDNDTAALVDVTNASLTITTSPLVVGYDIDTTAGAGVGFSEGSTFYGELWLVDGTSGRRRVKKWHIFLSDPNKSTFT